MAQPQSKRKLTKDDLAKALKLRDQNGIPLYLAKAVACGERSLSDVLKQMLREDRIAKLATKHEIDHDIARDMLDGDFDLDYALLKMRARRYLQEHRERSCLTQALESGEPVAVCADPDRVIVGRVRELEQYTFSLAPESGPPQALDKVCCHFVCAPGEAEAVLRDCLVDEGVRELDLAPERSPQERTHFKHAVLQGFLESGQPMRAITRRGLVLTGKLEWFSIWEIGMQIKRGPSITVFRHALHLVSKA
ncbi:MAG: hypothetical protein JXR96_01545 [Deltaproteobacteria bacterium]|nr:hypothetical protein [Deltaproteobacteria bacterium]